IANSFVRGFPFSQVKSANANGSAFTGLAEAACSCLDDLSNVAFACGDVGEAPDAASTLVAAGLGKDATAGAGAAVWAAASIGTAADEALFLASSSVTRFSSSSMRSSSQRSRSVIGIGALDKATAVFFSESPFPSSANAAAGVKQMHRNVA